MNTLCAPHSTWQPCGRVPVATVTAVAFAPPCTNSETDTGALVAVTLAGLAISYDRGATWQHPARGRLGPFVRSLVCTTVSTTPGAPPLMVATTPTGLFRSQDSGHTWAAASETSTRWSGPLAAGPNGLLYLATDADRMVWRLEEGATRLTPLGQLPVPAVELAACDDGALLAATECGLLQSLDGVNWTIVAGTPAEPFAAVAAGGALWLAAAEAGGLWLGTGNSCRPIASAAVRASAVAIDAQGRRIAVAHQAGLWLSDDEGATWRTVLHVPTLAVALAADGRTLACGLVGAGLHLSHDGGAHWQSVEDLAVEDLAGAVPVQLAAVNAAPVVETIEGALASHEAGATWRMIGEPGDPYVPTACALVGVLRTGRILWRQGGSLRLSNPDEALSDCGLPAITAATLWEAHNAERWGAAATDGTTIAWRLDPDTAWHHDAPPIRPSARIDALGFAHQSGDDPTVVAGVVDASGGTIWWRTADGGWRNVLDGLPAHPGIRLAAASPRRGVFIGAGDRVWRAARAGPLLLTGDQIDARTAPSILALAATVAPDGGENWLTALTSAGLYVSHNGAVTWQPLPEPVGPPVTAIALAPTHTTVHLWVAQLGGGLHCLDLSLTTSDSA